MARSHGGRLILHEAFRSAPLKPARNLAVWLPPDYSRELHRRFPVCYLHDGQNLFDSATAFLGNAWGLGEVAAELIAENAIEPLIFVGIWNTGERRLYEYTHRRDGQRRGGGASRYGKAIVQHIKPFIDATYRTQSESEHTALGGSSLGGLVTAYIGLRHPDIFGKLMIMSPSVWWAERSILQYVPKGRGRTGQKIWLDIGTSEGDEPSRMVEDVRRLRDALIERGWEIGHDLAYCEDEGACHTEQAWGRRARQALRFLFPSSGTVEGDFC